MTSKKPKAHKRDRQRIVGAPLPVGLESEARLTLAQVSTLTGRGRTKIYADMKAGRLPQPERSGLRCSRWRAGDVIDALKAAA